jgi:hypothetical protein
MTPKRMVIGNEVVFTACRPISRVTMMSAERWLLKYRSRMLCPEKLSGYRDNR